MSTYTTRASGAAFCATSCTLPRVGMPEPMSRNCLIPAAMRNRTARRRSGAVGLGLDGYVRHHRDALLGCRPVDGEVVRTAQEIVDRAAAQQGIAVMPDIAVQAQAN